MSIQFSYVALYASLGRMSLTYIRGYCHFAEGRAYFLLHYASRLCNDTLFFLAGLSSLAVITQKLITKSISAINSSLRPIVRSF